MAKRREIICDRCEKVIANLDRRGINILKVNSAKIKRWQNGQSRVRFGERIDLCVVCAKEFDEFLKGEKEDVTETSDNL